MKIYDLKCTLDKSGQSFSCPKCGKKTLTKYVYNHSNDYVGDEYGHCKRGLFCQYDFAPSYYFIGDINYVLDKELYGIDNYAHVYGSDFKRECRFPRTISPKTLKKSMDNYKNSGFAKFLITHLNEDAIKLLNEYYVGYVRFEKKDANIFWRIDNNFIIRAGDVVNFSEYNGKNYNSRCVTEVYNKKIPFFDLFHCFFGAHLINLYPDKEIAIVEDEKTALVCSHFWPEYNWLATGSMPGIPWREYEVYNALLNKKVTIYSDFKIPVLSRRVKSNMPWEEMVEYYKSEFDSDITIKQLFKDKINNLPIASQKLIYLLLEN